MIKITLKIVTLLLLSFLSTQSVAKSPWAEEEFTDTTATQNQPQTESELETAPLAQQESGRPAMLEEDILEPVAVEQTEVEEEIITETVQQGDVLDTPTQVASVRILDFPRRGMTTDKVQNELGQPVDIYPAVGQPPISRWVYDDRTVYFEYSSVIHVVAR